MAGRETGLGFTLGRGMGAVPIAIRASDNNPAVFISTAARNTYYTNNPDELATLENGEQAVAIGPTDGDASDITGAFIRQGGQWQPIATNFVGSQGPAGVAGPAGAPGAPGTPGADFSFDPSVEDGDVLVKSGTQAVSSGLKRQANGDLATERSIMVGPGSLGLGPMRVQSYVNAIGGDLADGTAITFAHVKHTTTGAERLARFKYGVETDLNVCTAQDQTITLPQVITYTTVGDNITENFKLIPAEAGELHVVFRLTDANGPVIFDERKTFEASDVDTVTALDLGNSHILPAGTALHVTLEGVDLKGGVGVAGDVAVGQTLPYAVTVIHSYQELPVADVQDILTAFNHNDHQGISVEVSTDPTTGNPKVVLNVPTSGGGTPPSQVSTDLRHGLSNESNPANVTFSLLTDVASPTDPITLQTGEATAGQYYHIFTSNTHEIVQILDTVLSQVVYQRGASSTANIFTLVEDAITESSVTYDALSIGPLNAGFNERYEVRFS